MKRVKYACLSQTIHFTLSEKVPHQEAVTLALKERQNCLEEMERRGVAHQVDRSYQLEDGTPVALVYLKTWYDEEPGVGLVGGFCIDGDYRGCGLSAQILGQAISVYRSLGRDWLCAHVAEKNMRAQGFYHKFAFEQRGEYRDENGLHYRMFKALHAK